MKTKTINQVFLAALLPVLLACGKQSQESTSSGLQVREAWVRAMPPGSPVAAGYMQLHNPGRTALRVSGLSSPLAERVEAHDMTMENGQMRMRESEIALAPGESLALEPGGRHLMFFGVKAPFAEGQSVALTIRLDDGSSQQLSLPVRSEAAAESGHAHH